MTNHDPTTVHTQRSLPTTTHVRRTNLCSSVFVGSEPMHWQRVTHTHNTLRALRLTFRASMTEGRTLDMYAKNLSYTVSMEWFTGVRNFFWRENNYCFFLWTLDWGQRPTCTTDPVANTRNVWQRLRGCACITHTHTHTLSVALLAQPRGEACFEWQRVESGWGKIEQAQKPVWHQL